MAQVRKCHAGGIDWSWLSEMIVWFFIDLCMKTDIHKNESDQILGKNKLFMFFDKYRMQHVKLKLLLTCYQILFPSLSIWLESTDIHVLRFPNIWQNPIKGNILINFPVWRHFLTKSIRQLYICDAMINKQKDPAKILAAMFSLVDHVFIWTWPLIVFIQMLEHCIL